MASGDQAALARSVRVVGGAVCEVVEAAAQVRGSVIIVCVLPSSWVLSYVDV